MVLVHHDGNLRVGLDGGLHQVLDERLAGVLARTRTCLEDHRCPDFLGRFHDRLHLFQVVDVEGRNAVTVLGRVVEQFAQGDECHGKTPEC